MKKDEKPGRRAFLKGAGATLAGVAAAPIPVQGQAQSPTSAKQAKASAPPPAGYQSLSLEEAATTEALVAHMWPADQLTPSGVDLGIATYMDRQLAGGFGRGDRLYTQGPFRKGKA